jgi:hypothetical protein
MMNHATEGKYVCDKRMSSYDSIKYCLLQIAERFTLNYRDISLSYHYTLKISCQKKIMVAILQLFPKTTGCDNFRTM